MCENLIRVCALFNANIGNIYLLVAPFELELTEVTLDMINKEDDDERLLRMQNQAIDGNNEVHEEIFDELEDKFLNMIDYSA